MRLRMSRRIRGEDFWKWTEACQVQVHVLFHRNVPRGIYRYIYNTFVPEVRTLQGFILDLVCGPPWLLELLPTISPVPTSILKFVKNPDPPPPPPATESTPRRPFSLPINLRNFQLSRWKNRLPFLSTRKDDTKRREKKEREKKQID